MDTITHGTRILIENMDHYYIYSEPHICVSIFLFFCYQLRNVKITDFDANIAYVHVYQHRYIMEKIIFYRMLHDFYISYKILCTNGGGIITEIIIFWLIHAFRVSGDHQWWCDYAYSVAFFFFFFCTKKSKNQSVFLFFYLSNHSRIRKKTKKSV